MIECLNLPKRTGEIYCFCWALNFVDFNVALNFEFKYPRNIYFSNFQYYSNNKIQNEQTLFNTLEIAVCRKNTKFDTL